MIADFWRADAVVQRVCHNCGAPWTIGQGACACGATVFDEMVVAPEIPEDTKPPEARGWS